MSLQRRSETNPLAEHLSKLQKKSGITNILTARFISKTADVILNHDDENISKYFNSTFDKSNMDQANKIAQAVVLLYLQKQKMIISADTFRIETQIEPNNLLAKNNVAEKLKVPQTSNFIRTLLKLYSFAEKKHIWNHRKLVTVRLDLSGQSKALTLQPQSKISTMINNSLDLPKTKQNNKKAIIEFAKTQIIQKKTVENSKTTEKKKSKSRKNRSHQWKAEKDQVTQKESPEQTVSQKSLSKVGENPSIDENQQTFNKSCDVKNILSDSQSSSGGHPSLKQSRTSPKQQSSKTSPSSKALLSYNTTNESDNIIDISLASNGKSVTNSNRKMNESSSSSISDLSNAKLSETSSHESFEKLAKKNESEKNISEKANLSESSSKSHKSSPKPQKAHSKAKPTLKFDDKHFSEDYSPRTIGFSSNSPKDTIPNTSGESSSPIRKRIGNSPYKFNILKANQLIHRKAVHNDTAKKLSPIELHFSSSDEEEGINSSSSSFIKQVRKVPLVLDELDFTDDNKKAVEKPKEPVIIPIKNASQAVFQIICDEEEEGAEFNKNQSQDQSQEQNQIPDSSSSSTAQIVTLQDSAPIFDLHSNDIVGILNPDDMEFELCLECLSNDDEMKITQQEINASKSEIIENEENNEAIEVPEIKLIDDSAKENDNTVETIIQDIIDNELDGQFTADEMKKETEEEEMMSLEQIALRESSEIIQLDSNLTEDEEQNTEQIPQNDNKQNESIHQVLNQEGESKDETEIIQDGALEEEEEKVESQKNSQPEEESINGNNNKIEKNEQNYSNDHNESETRDSSAAFRSEDYNDLIQIEESEYEVSATPYVSETFQKNESDSLVTESPREVVINKEEEHDDSNYDKQEEIPLQPTEAQIEVVPVVEASVEEVPVEEAQVEEVPIEEAQVEEVPIEEASVEEVPIEEAQVEEVPVEEVPIEETPVEEVPIEEVPVEEVPIEETPVEEVPVVEASVEEVPVEEVPIEETPVEEVPVVEASVEEVPVVEAPVEEVPVVEAPVEEVPIEEASVEEVPVVEASVEEVPIEEQSNSKKDEEDKKSDSDDLADDFYEEEEEEDDDDDEEEEEGEVTKAKKLSSSDEEEESDEYEEDT